MLHFISLQQPTIANYMLPSASQNYSATSKRRQEFDRKLAVFIAKDMRPPSIVEGKGFQGLMKFADPQYVLPSRRKVVRDLLPTLAREITSDLKKNLDKVKV